jgi:hypothetical protein
MRDSGRVGDGGELREPKSPSPVASTMNHSQKILSNFLLRLRPKPERSEWFSGCAPNPISKATMVRGSWHGHVVIFVSGECPAPEVII